MYCRLTFFNIAQYYVALLGVNYGKEFSEPDGFQGRFEQESPKLPLTTKLIITLITLKVLVCVCVCVCVCVYFTIGTGKVEILKETLNVKKPLRSPEMTC